MSDSPLSIRERKRQQIAPQAAPDATPPTSDSGGGGIRERKRAESQVTPARDQAEAIAPTGFSWLADKVGGFVSDTAQGVMNAFTGEGADQGHPELRQFMQQTMQQQLDEIEGNPNEDIDVARQMYNVQKRYRDAFTAMSYSLGDDRGLVSAVKKALPPDTEFTQQGSYVIAKLPNGQKTYINAPGLSMEDFVKIFSHVGTAALVPNRSLGVLASTAKETLIAASLDDAAVAAGATDRASLEEFLIGAGLGAATQKIASLSLPQLKKFAKWMHGARLGDNADAARLRAIGRQVGVDYDDLPVNIRRRLEAHINQLVDERAAVRSAQAEALGIPVTRRQRIGLSPLSGKKNDELAKAVHTRQQQALERAVDTETARLGGNRHGGPQQPAMEMREALVARADTEKAAFGRLFDEVDRMPLSQSPAIPRDFMAQNIKDIKRGLLETRNRSSLEGKHYVNQVLHKVNKLMKRKPDAQFGDDIPWRDYRIMMKDLNETVADMPSTSFAGQKNIITKEILPKLRRIEDDALTHKLFSGGDVSYVIKGREARDLRVRWRKRFEDNSIINTLVERNAGTDELTLPPEKTLNFLFGSTGITGKNATGRTMMHLKRILSPDEFARLKVAGHLRLFEQATNRQGVFSGAEMQRVLRKMQQENGPVYRELFEPAERTFHQKIANAGEFVQADGTLDPVVGAKLDRAIFALADAAREAPLRGLARTKYVGSVADLLLQYSSTALRPIRTPGSAAAGTLLQQEEEKANVQ